MAGHDPKASDAKVLKTEPLSPTSAHWTRLILSTYTDPLGERRTWEHAERTTRPATSTIDGVGIIALLTPNNPNRPTGDSNTSTGTGTSNTNNTSSSNSGGGRGGGGGGGGPEIVLQKQFRPPLNKVVIEIPAGLVDEGEGAEECAVRELREETGYHGEIGAAEVSPVMFNDPGFCNTNLALVHVNIDTALAVNQDLKTELEENEFIEVFTHPLRDLYAECKRLEKQGYAIDARVGTLAEGIELSRRLGL